MKEKTYLRENIPGARDADVSQAPIVVAAVVLALAIVVVGVAADDPSGILNPGKTRKSIHTGFFEPYSFPKGWGQLPTIIFKDRKSVV